MISNEAGMAMISNEAGMAISLPAGQSCHVVKLH